MSSTKGSQHKSKPKRKSHNDIDKNGKTPIKIPKTVIDQKKQSSKRKQSDDEEKKWQPKSILQDGVDGPANKKRALRRQRNSQKPNFEAVCQSKMLWNELREKKCSEERRAELVGELHGALTGKYKEVALKHDASRLVQAVIQFGSEEQRLSVLDEIGKGSGFMELCRSTYAHYVVVKLIEHLRSKEGLRKLTEALRGNICALATHSVAARVVELALMNLKTHYAASLRLELYGREFAVFVDETLKEVLNENKNDLLGENSGSQAKHIPVSMKPTLSVLLKIRPTRSEQILAHVSGVVGKLILKGLLPFQYAHELLCEYAQCCTDSQFQELMPSIIEHSLTLLSTRPGTRVVCDAAIRGGAKERRRLLKIIKGHTAALLAHRDAYLIVLVLCEVTDDTVALQNSLLAELCVVPTAEDIARSEQFSANPFLDKTEEAGDEEENDIVVNNKELKDDDLSAFSPLLGVCLNGNSAKLLLRLMLGENANSHMDPFELAILNTPSESSKKDPQVRRDELTSFLEDPMNKLVIDHAEALLSNRYSGVVLTAFFSKMTIARTGTAAAAVASVAPRVLDDAVAHSVLKNILKAEAAPDCSVSPLAEAMLTVFKADSSALNLISESNRAAFVFAALVSVCSVRSEVCCLLQPLLGDIRSAASTSKGAALLAQEIQSVVPNQGAKTPAKTPKDGKVKTPKGKAPTRSSKSEASNASTAQEAMKDKKFSPLATRSARKKRNAES